QILRQCPSRYRHSCPWRTHCAGTQTSCARRVSHRPGTQTCVPPSHLQWPATQKWAAEGGAPMTSTRGGGGGTPIRSVSLSARAAETKPATTRRTTRKRMIRDICTSIEEEDVSSSVEDYTPWPLA